MNDIQVWNNAAFDNHGGDTFFPMKTSWSSSESTKENLSPTALNSSPKPKKNTKTKVFALSSDDNRNIDDEIEVLEREITRLTTRLDALRLEKAKRGKRVVGRAVPAKFMEPRQNAAVLRKPEETPKTKVKSVNNNQSAWRRGMSMGPAEIAATPATAQSRRKSCFWKLPEIDEESRAKTVGRVRKKEEFSAVQVQARNMFDREKMKSLCESNKKAVKPGRMVASRYNGGGDVRKRSLPEGGSEVRVKEFDLELHAVHQNSKGETAVIGIWYKIGRPDRLLSKLLKDLKSLGDKDLDLGVINPGIIKFGSRKYYRYVGSLTTPPCTEGVVWTIVKKVRTVSREQLRALKAALHHEYEDNARPTQEVNGREVWLYRAKENAKTT